jgi:hypothetical protein
MGQASKRQANSGRLETGNTMERTSQPEAKQQ